MCPYGGLCVCMVWPTKIKAYEQSLLFCSVTVSDTHLNYITLEYNDSYSAMECS